MAQLININSTEFRRCNLSAIQSGGTWASIVPDENEIILISTTDSLTSGGSGECDAYIKGDGTALASELELKLINPELYIEENAESPTSFTVIGVNDGVGYGNHPDYIASDYIPCNGDFHITINNQQGLTLNWLRIFFYNGDTYVRYASIRNSQSSESVYNYDVVYDGTFDKVRINTSKATNFESVEDIQILYDRSVSLADKVVQLEQEVDALDIPTEAEIEQIVKEQTDGLMGDVAETIEVSGTPTMLTYTNGKYINQSGNEAPSANMALTDYIKTFGAEEVSIQDNSWSTKLSYYTFAFYDASKVFISGVKYVTPMGTAEIPANAVFMRISVYIDSTHPAKAKYLISLYPKLDEAITQVNSLTEQLSDGETATNDDIETSDYFSISNGVLSLLKPTSASYQAALFKDNIIAIEFTIARLWDSNLIAVAFGKGKDESDVECFAGCYVGTSARPNTFGGISNYRSSTAQSNSLYGQGRFSGDYRQPQIHPVDVSIGSRCRIELIDGFFSATIYNETTKMWNFWWCLDTFGTWTTPDRYGWNISKNIGFASLFQAYSVNTPMLTDIKILARKGEASGVQYLMKKQYATPRRWVAIGDSITEIDKNNGLSYVGHAKRKLGWDCVNKGVGGWTIYKLWRDRALAIAGWEDAVSALSDNDVVTILAGTNDFDTKAFSTPASDEAMDAAGSPHPRFGTTDPTSVDAKDPHTTLGCLRLMIERILELKPSARLIVFSPFYREKGSLNGSTGWNKDLYINSDGKTIYDYADAIYSVAREYNLPAYNTCRDCGINVQTLATYTYDDLHIGQMGGQLIGEYVAKRIRP